MNRLAFGLPHLARVVAGLLSLAVIGSVALRGAGLDQSRWAVPPGEATWFQDVPELKSLSLFDVVFDRQGTVWVATSDGLYSYDGFEWIRYGKTNGFPSAYIRTLTLTRSGDLWVGSDRGAGVFQNSGFRLLAPTNMLAGPSVRRICEDPDGTLWFCCDRWPDPNVPGGLTSYDGQTWKTYRQEQGLPEDYPYHYFRDSLGRQFVITRKGVALKRGDRWETVLSEEIWDLVEAPDSRVMGFNAGTNFIFENGKFMTVPIPSSPTKRTPKCLFRDNQGGILAHGLGRWDGKGFESFTSISAYDLSPERIRQAEDGSYWCVDSRTLVRWRDRPPAWREYKSLPAPAFVDAQGRPWFIGWFESYRLNPEGFELLPGLTGEVRHTLMDHRGVLWLWPPDVAIRSYDHGFTDYPEGQTGLKEVLGGVQDAEHRLWFYGYGSGNQRRVSCYDGRQWQWIDIPGLSRRELLAGQADPASGVWLSSIGEDRALGFLRVELAQGKITVKRVGTTQRAGPNFLVDSQGDLWTYGPGGVFRFTGSLTNKHWEAIPELRNTLTCDAVFSGSNLWFTTSGVFGGKNGFGVYQNHRWQGVETDLPTLVHFDQDRIAVTPGNRYCSPDGTLYFSGSRMVHLVPNSDLGARRILSLPEGYSLPVFMLVDGQGVLWMQARLPDGTATVLSYVPDSVVPKAIVLEAAPSVQAGGQWHPEIKGVDRFRTDSHQRRFQYSWRFDEQEFGPFQDLPAAGFSLAGYASGRHVFQVKARNEGLNQQQVPTTFAFDIEPLSLQSRPWFRPVVVLLFAALLALGLLAGYRSQQLAALNASLRAAHADLRQAHESLTRANAELQQANLELEKRVAERTDTLARTITRLQAEIWERHRSEEQRHQLEQQILQSQKMESLGVLAGGIAHDFNNLLTTIIGNTDLVLSDLPPSSPGTEGLRQIRQASVQAAHLCQQMLAYSGKGRFVMQKLDLTALVREMQPMLDSTVTSKATWEYQLAEDLPKIEADASQLRQVLINLALNASEAIGDQSGSIAIRTSAQQGDREFLSSSQWSHPLPEGRYAMLEVADSGCGMAQPTLGKIFDPFFTTKFTGRGLGLAAVAGIVRGHKGAIKVTSQPGAGSTFTVLFPVPTDSPPPPPSPAPPPSATPVVPAPRQGQVLLVDDEEQVRSVGRRLLRRLGFEVVTAASGPEAIAFCRQDPAGCLCVLLDLTMPGMNGQETLRELRRLRADLPILMASGYSEVELAEQFARDGLSGFIQKPFTLESLKAKLDQVLQAKP